MRKSKKGVQLILLSFISRRNQLLKNEYYKQEEQVESYRTPTISIRELREMTDTVKEYQRFTNFSRKILDLPLKEINAHTSFNVSYDKVKKGRSVDSIVFHITKKPVAKNISNN